MAALECLIVGRARTRGIWRNFNLTASIWTRASGYCGRFRAPRCQAASERTSQRQDGREMWEGQEGARMEVESCQDGQRVDKELTLVGPH